MIKTTFRSIDVIAAGTTATDQLQPRRPRHCARRRPALGARRLQQQQPRPRHRRRQPVRRFVRSRGKTRPTSRELDTYVKKTTTAAEPGTVPLGGSDLRQAQTSARRAAPRSSPRTPGTSTAPPVNSRLQQQQRQQQQPHPQRAEHLHRRDEPRLDLDGGGQTAPRAQPFPSVAPSHGRSGIGRLASSPRWARGRRRCRAGHVRPRHRRYQERHRREHAPGGPSCGLVPDATAPTRTRCLSVKQASQTQPLSPSTPATKTRCPDTTKSRHALHIGYGSPRDTDSGVTSVAFNAMAQTGFTHTLVTDTTRPLRLQCVHVDNRKHGLAPGSSRVTLTDRRHARALDRDDDHTRHHRSDRLHAQRPRRWHLRPEQLDRVHQAAASPTDAGPVVARTSPSAPVPARTGAADRINGCAFTSAQTRPTGLLGEHQPAGGNPTARIS